MLPALQSAKESARDILCKSNLKQVMLTYTMYLGEYDWTIPLNIQSGMAPNSQTAMDIALNKQGSDIGLSWSPAPPVDFRTCPTAASKVKSYQPMYYSVNVYWDLEAGPLFNEGKRWDQIKSPSKFPFWWDALWQNCGPDGNGDNRHVQCGFGPFSTAGIDYSSIFYCVGPIHGGARYAIPGSASAYGQNTNVAYSDGHVSGVNIREMTDKGLHWFENDGE